MDTSQPVAPPRDGVAAAPADLRSLDKVRGIFVSLAKFIGAQAIYQSNNPNLVKFARAFEDSFRSYFESETELLLAVSQYQLVWREQVVYDIGPNTESIAFLLYKDGVGELSVQRGVERAELEQFTRILKTALYSPSTQFDIATALWHAELPGISYRVLDEQSDAGDGEGDSAYGSQREQPLRANDHRDLPASEQRISRESDDALEPLGDYYHALALHGGAPGSAENEQAMQRILRDALHVNEDELARWSTARAPDGGDELLAFLRVILDFTRAPCSPPVIRDVMDTIERIIHYVRDEGHVATLMATLDIAAELREMPQQAPFSPLPARIQAELTDTEYLVTLARGSREANSPLDLLRYFAAVGEGAVGAVWELLSHHADDAIHERGCALLVSIPGRDLRATTDSIDVDNLRLARDVVFLLGRSPGLVVTPVVHRMLGASDPQIRRCALELLMNIPGDESARLLMRLLHDDNPGVRQRAWGAAGNVPNALLATEVEALCFAESASARSPEELELMFRALGRLCGYSVLPRLRAMVERKQLFTAQKSRIRREKLLAITALRFIPGAEAQRILDTLAADGDTLIRTKAAHATKQRATPGLNDSAELATAGRDAS